VGDDAAPVVTFQHLDSFGGPPVVLENRSKSSTMVVDSCGVTIVGDGGGDILATNCPARVRLLKAGQKLWARSLNAEGGGEEGLVQVAGGDAWVMGTKNEGKSVRYRITAGGRAEVFGAYEYTNFTPEKGSKLAMFEVDNASLCIMGMRETAHTGGYGVKVRENRGQETKEWTGPMFKGAPGFSLFSAWKDK
jgi:hypothetical protein